MVPEKDENVLGSLGGVETFDSRNRDGSLGGAGTDTNTMGSLSRAFLIPKFLMHHTYVTSCHIIRQHETRIWLCGVACPMAG